MIEKLVNYQMWSKDEIEILIDAALNNTQIRYILTDPDVKFFYKTVLRQMPQKNEKAKEIETLLKG